MVQILHFNQAQRISRFAHVPLPLNKQYANYLLRCFQRVRVTKYIYSHFLTSLCILIMPAEYVHCTKKNPIDSYISISNYRRIKDQDLCL